MTSFATVEELDAADLTIDQYITAVYEGEHRQRGTENDLTDEKRERISARIREAIAGDPLKSSPAGLTDDGEPTYKGSYIAQAAQVAALYAALGGKFKTDAK